jgi:hypothetical protein
MLGLVQTAVKLVSQKRCQPDAKTAEDKNKERKKYYYAMHGENNKGQ